MALQFYGTLEELQRLQKIAAAHGWLASLEELNTMWEAHSKSRCAGWLGIENCSDDALWEIMSDPESTIAFKDE